MSKLTLNYASIILQSAAVCSYAKRYMQATKPLIHNTHSDFSCWQYAIADCKNVSCWKPGIIRVVGVCKFVCKSIYKYIASYEACLFIFSKSSSSRKRENPSVNNPR